MKYLKSSSFIKVLAMMSNLHDLQDQCLKLYAAQFGDSSEVMCGYAPGRVNLIGEHTDYNNGFVFPMALADLGTFVVGKSTSERTVKLITGAPVDCNVVQFVPKKTQVSEVPQWARYVMGVVECFMDLTDTSISANIAIQSNLPIGAGLSSSASLEVAVFTLLERLCGVTDIPDTDKIRACQRAEHEYAHVPCGIMDQYIATLGNVDTALFINCQTDECEDVSFGSDSVVLVVTDTHVKHELAGGEFANRRASCEAVAKSMGVGSLAEVTLDQVNAHFTRLGADLSHLPEKAFPRARHVVLEISRTVKAKECFLKGDLVMFGQLMNESHRSLSGDYEVSCKELDQVVETAWRTEGVLGSRMTGGGFGGCAITLIKKEHTNAFLQRLKEKCPFSSSFITTPGVGAKAWANP